MNKRFRTAWLTFKMFWATFSRPAQIAIIAIPILCALILLYAPGHDYWVLLCGVTLALLPFTLLAIFLLFKEIK